MNVLFTIQIPMNTAMIYMYNFQIYTMKWPLVALL